MMSKQIETEVVQALENILAHVKCDAARVFSVLMKSLSEFTLSAQQEMANCVEMLSSWVASVREASSFKLSAFISSTSAEPTGTEPFSSAGASSEEGPQ